MLLYSNDRERRRLPCVPTRIRKRVHLMTLRKKDLRGAVRLLTRKGN